MRLPLFTKSRQWIALGAFAATLVALLLLPAFLHWSPLNCWHEDIDINTGRVRHLRYLLFCQVGDRTEDTWLSRSSDNSNSKPDWRRVNTFSPGISHSPHYRFHGAIHQVELLQSVDSLIEFDPVARREVADKLLTLWQNRNSDSSADEFVEQVAQTAVTLRENGASTFRASDLPPLSEASAEQLGLY